MKRLLADLLPRSFVNGVARRRLDWFNPRVRRLLRSAAGQSPWVYYAIGARGGLGYVAEFLRSRGLIASYGFEADPVEAERLERNNAFDRVIPHPVGSANARLPFYVTRDPGCASFLEPNCESIQLLAEHPECFDVISTCTLATRRLDDLVVEYQLPQPEILEIDTQGYEHEILRGCGALLSSVYAISLELHHYPLYCGQSTFQEVKDFLDGSGFRLAMMKPNGHFGDQLVEVNACFVNARYAPSDSRRRAMMGYWKIVYRIA